MVLDMYTDCSGSIDKYGIGVLITNYEDFEMKFSLKTNISEINKELETTNDGSISIGEMFAVLTGLSVINTEKIEKINIYTDSYHTFVLMNNINRTKVKALSRIKNKINEYKKVIPIDVMWIKGHIGIWGNEIVDKVAKKSLRSKTQVISNVQIS